MIWDIVYCTIYLKVYALLYSRLYVRRHAFCSSLIDLSRSSLLASLKTKALFAKFSKFLTIAIESKAKFTLCIEKMPTKCFVWAEIINILEILHNDKTPSAKSAIVFYLKRTYVGSKKAFELSTLLYWSEVLSIWLFFVSITFNLII